MLKLNILVLMATCAILANFVSATEVDIFGAVTNDEEISHAMELDTDSFPNAIAGNNVFVKFFAPWCGHCKRLQPLWEQLAEIMLEVQNVDIIIAKVDCTKHQTLCSKYDITGYPTLRLFKLGVEESIKFKGSRDLPTIIDFINHQFNTRILNEPNDVVNEIANEYRGRVVELDESNFAKHVSIGNHFVDFFAPWCSHCQRLSPTWDALAKDLKSVSSVSISKIDCTQHRSICQDFDVKGYPTLLWIENGKKIEKYSGSRDLDELKIYVNNMLADSIDAVIHTAGTSEKDEPKINDSAAANDVTIVIDDAKIERKAEAVSLDAKKFNSVIKEGIVFVKFYAPWCGHCQKLASTWDELAAQMHATENGITIAKLDCTNAENKQICVEQLIEGYPTLFAYKNGERQTEYDGTRDLRELAKYITKFITHDEL